MTDNKFPVSPAARDVVLGLHAALEHLESALLHANFAYNMSGDTSDSGMWAAAEHDVGALLQRLGQLNLVVGRLRVSALQDELRMKALARENSAKMPSSHNSVEE